SEEGNLAHSNMFPDPSLHPEGAKKSLASQMIKQLGIEMVTPPSDILADDMLIKADDLWIKDILKR
ncbi:MAG: hypothetical protein HW414_1168, partial [Dehalococcoidia bacterium]|nr:hypothetical protein [Dehalococcoidia bacterium]